MKNIKDILKSTFGYDSFRSEQEHIISSIINGNDSLVVMPTGGGKSMCFQLPAIAMKGTALVVSPLIALMEDQVAALHENGVSAAYLNSTLSYDERLYIEDSYIDGSLDILYMAPERLTQPESIEFLKCGKINLLAIDEAHCVSQWGHDFRPEYRQLNIVKKAFPNIPTVALTATADPTTQQDIILQLGLVNPDIFVCGFDRPNITYNIQERDNPKKQLLDFLNEHNDESGIIYCSTRKEVEDYTDFVNEKGFYASAYHAGLPVKKRSEALEMFQRSDGMIIVATIAFGMGIDKPDVRFVAHVNLPKSMEAYYQETGRAGRDGEPATAWMIYGMKDIILQKSFITQGEGSEEFKRVSIEKLNSLLAFCETAECRRIVLLKYFGEIQHEGCNNCDNCLTPPKTFDATVLAQKALSNAYRTGERFGVTYLTDVLLGKTNERIEQFRHDQVSTFGIGKELSSSEWKNLYRQLAVAGFCEIDIEQYNSVKLNKKSYQILKKEVEFWARKMPKRKAKAEKSQYNINSKAGAKNKADSITKNLSDGDKELLKALTDLNTELAEKHKVPKYVVFNRATLAEMAAEKPTTDEEFLNINGVGNVKLRTYGKDFMDMIKSYK